MEIMQVRADLETFQTLGTNIIHIPLLYCVCMLYSIVCCIELIVSELLSESQSDTLHHDRDSFRHL